MNCIIVDDERLAQDVLENYVSKTPQLNLIAKLNNAIDLFKYLHSDTQVDLVFLDIQMPEMSGLELVKALKNVPDIIFTTAYHEYALDAFNLNAIDYLLKPFSYDRFMQAIVKSSHFKVESSVKTTAIPEENFYVKSEKKLVNINTKEILYIEGLKNYYEIVSQDNKSTIVHNTLNNLELSLTKYPNILRVHRSFFVNIDLIKEITNSEIILVNNKEIPIGQTYRDMLLSKLKVI